MGSLPALRGKWGFPHPAECAGGRERAVLVPGDCLAGDGLLPGPPTHAAEAESSVFPPSLRRRKGTSASALSLPSDPAVPLYLTHIEPADLIRGQQEDGELAPLFVKGSEDIEEREEFVLHLGVLCCRLR